tara:strand:- start:2404 stop:3180 length:777 start_codon:yes stop_codon:yes gene_type:complete
MSKKKSEPIDWLVEQLRFSAFMSAPLAPNHELDEWHRIAKSDPANVLTKPAEGVLRKEGEFDGKLLTYEQSPLRIDWRLSSNGQNPFDESPWPVFGHLNSETEKFIQLMKTWLTNAPPLNRIAFGLILLRPKNTNEDSLKLLGRVLPDIKIDHLNTRDFNYKINRRRKSKSISPKLEINRLSSWSIASLSHIAVELLQGQTQGSRATEMTERLYACRVELDINTAPEFDSNIAKSKRKNLLDELNDLAIELSLKGDIK